MGRHLKITINPDSDVESPCEHACQWQVYSFNRKHKSFKHPENFFKENGRPKMAIANKMKVGLAFILGYHEHGQCQWALSGEQQPCDWDSVDMAGLLVWEHKPADIGGKTKEDRAKDARSFLEEYTNWCNGACYYFQIEDENGEEIDSCGGFIGEEHMFNMIAESIEPGDEWEFDGIAKDIAPYHEKVLREKSELTAA